MSVTVTTKTTNLITAGDLSFGVESSVGIKANMALTITAVGQPISPKDCTSRVLEQTETVTVHQTHDGFNPIIKIKAPGFQFSHLAGVMVTFTLP